MKKFLKILFSLGLFLLAFSLIVSAISGGGWLAALLAACSAFFGFAIWPTATEGKNSLAGKGINEKSRSTTPARLQVDEANTVWLGKSERLKIHGRVIDRPMIYLNRKGQDHKRDTVAFTMSATKVGKVTPAELPYWPSYTEVGDDARGAYLDWLSSGKTGQADLGLVFLYFYGLERRAFLDQSKEEWPDIRAEMLRLLTEYGSNRSVHSHMIRAISFMDACAALLNGNIPIVDDLELKPDMKETTAMSDLIVAHHISEAGTINAETLLGWYLHHRDYRLKTPGIRAFKYFSLLFKRRFADKYPGGMKVKLPKSSLVLTYDAASRDFEAEIKTDFPNVANMTAPLNQAEKLAESCQDELAAYSRFVGKNLDAAESVQALSLLPDELGDAIVSDEVDQLYDWLEAKVEASAAPVLTHQLFDKLGVDYATGGRALTKSQRRKAIEVCQKFGFSFEPEPDLTSHTCRAGDPLVLFQLPEATPGEFGRAHDFADVGLNLMISVAAADGHIDPNEQHIIYNQIETNPNLTARERAHLHAREKWLSLMPPSQAKTRNMLKDLPRQQAKVLAAIAIQTAMADGKASAKEMKLLEKVYTTLGLDIKELYDVVSANGDGVVKDLGRQGLVSVRPASSEPGYTIPTEFESPQPTPFSLNKKALEKIETDTAKAQSILTAQFDVAPAGKIELTEKNEKEVSQFLTEPQRSLVKALLSQESWPLDRFEQMAGDLGLKGRSATMAINDWSSERFEGPLLEEFDGAMEVDIGLLPNDWSAS